jgi:hypothetical protein
MRVVLAVVATIVTSCACSNPPAGNVTAFFAGGDASRDVVATVAAITPLAELGGFRYDMRNGARLTWIAKEPIAALQVGRTVRIVVDYSPGSPDASGILIFDGERLLFAALSDQNPFQHVLEGGISGFAIATQETRCASRARTRCHTSLVNLRLSIEHAGERKVLVQGESARLGEFAVDALVAQKVIYNPRCADAGLPGVCFVIRRVQ